MENLTEIDKYCKELRRAHANRVKIQKTMEDIYMMRDTDEDKALRAASDTVALVKDPSDRNAIVGARRLMSSTDAIVNVRFDVNDPEMKAISGKLEKVAYALIAASDRYSRKPLIYNAPLSMLIYDAVHIQVVSTEEAVSYAKGASDVAMRRWEKIRKMTPYIFKVLNPISGYPEFDEYGLVRYHRQSMVSVGSILDAYGASARKILGKDGEDRLKDISLCEYWDAEKYKVWADGKEEAFHEADEKFIPIICTMGEGTDLFGAPEDQIEPMLFTEAQSEFYKRRNEIFTGFFTTVRDLGLTPIYGWKHPGTEERPAIKRDGFLMYIDEGSGDFSPKKSKGIVDESLQLAISIAEKKGEESTIYKTTLGQPMQGAPYSLQAMLANLGRLPLETTRAMAGRAIADALEMAFMWWKEDGGANKVMDFKKGFMTELAGKEISDNLTLDVKLDVALPQDMVQQASIYNALYGKISERWLMENIMKISNTDEMTKELVVENMVKMLAGQFMQNMQMQGQMQMQSQIPPSVAARMGDGSTPPQEMPTEAGGAEQPVMGARGMPLVGTELGLPPEMSTAGQMPEEASGGLELA